MAIDLFGPYVWTVFVLGLLLLTPLKSGVGRKWILAALNVAFILCLLHRSWKQALLFTVGLACVYTMLRLLQKTRNPTVVAWVGGVGLFCAWLLHKLPPAMAFKITRTDYLSAMLAAIGFSYVTLRIIDAMRAILEDSRPAPDLAQTINYLMPFNMLAAGPIQSYEEYLAAPGVPEALTFQQTLSAFERIVHGLFKKYVLALTLERIFLTGFRAHGGYLFFEAQLYYIWLYLDFSAYSDIAVGIGTLLGVATPENFDRPFLARNVIDFWQRWHISLSLFIRRNIFLPLQLAFVRRTGGKNQLAAASAAFFVSFLLCGLWHNISKQWFLWGVMQALGLITCNAYRYVLLKRHGRKWLNQQLANPWLRAVSIAVTFEFAALSLAATMFHH